MALSTLPTLQLDRLLTSKKDILFEILSIEGIFRRTGIPPIDKFHNMCWASILPLVWIDGNLEGTKYSTVYRTDFPACKRLYCRKSAFQQNSVAGSKECKGENTIVKFHK